MDSTAPCLPMVPLVSVFAAASAKIGDKLPNLWYNLLVTPEYDSWSNE